MGSKGASLLRTAACVLAYEKAHFPPPLFLFAEREVVSRENKNQIHIPITQALSMLAQVHAQCFFLSTCPAHCCHTVNHQYSLRSFPPTQKAAPNVRKADIVVGLSLG